MVSVRGNLFNKFIIAFISVGLLPVLFISLYSGYLFHKEADVMMTDNYRQAALYGAKNLDNLVEKYNTISKLLYSYNADNTTILRTADGLGFARILKGSGDNAAVQLKRYNDIISFLRLINASDTYISHAVFVEENNSVFAFSRNSRPFTDEADFFDQVHRKRPVEKANQLFFVPTHRDSYFQRADARVFTIGRNYIDLSYPVGTERILGTLYMDINLQALDDLFKRMDIYEKGSVFIIDTGGNLIYSNPFYDSRRGDTTGDMLEITEHSQATGWDVVFRIDSKNMLRNVTDIITLVYVIVTAILIVLLTLSVFYSKMFSEPVRKILEAMREVENGNFDIAFDVKGRDEIGQLADGFKQMTGKLEEYIRTSFLARLRWKEAELSSLKAKIKPHFLYNSLEIIRMNAVTNNDESTAELALLLADQMRYSLGQLDGKVPLSRELEMIRNYFAFIDIRYNHGIVWDIAAENGLEHAMVLGLMIQPVVENAIIHGIKPRGAGHVQIIAERNNADLVVRIMDDGIGMDQDILLGLTHQLNDDKFDDKDSEALEGGRDPMGLKNVHDRLRYEYGDPYGLSISSAPQIGTSVTMLLPLFFEEKDV